jgi:hypothetical protein
VLPFHYELSDVFADLVAEGWRHAVPVTS